MGRGGTADVSGRLGYKEVGDTSDCVSVVREVW